MRKRTTLPEYSANDLGRDGLLTVNQLAETLQVSVRTVWRLVSMDQLPKPIYIGRLARWKAKSIRNWIDSQQN